MKKSLSLLLSGLFLASQAVSAPKPKTAICHFDEEEGDWVAITISEQAVQAHMRNHDDGLPGGTTAQTGTQLDANCQAAAAEAPVQ